MPSLIFCLFSRLNDNGDHRQYPVKGRQVNGHPDRLRAQVAPGKEHPKADIAGQNGWGKLEAEGRVEQAGTQDAQVGHALLLGPEPIVEQEARAQILFQNRHDHAIGHHHEPVEQSRGMRQIGVLQGGCCHAMVELQVGDANPSPCHQQAQSHGQAVAAQPRHVEARVKEALLTVVAVDVEQGAHRSHDHEQDDVPNADGAALYGQIVN